MLDCQCLLMTVLFSQISMKDSTKMSNSVPRRSALKALGASGALMGLSENAAANQADNSVRDSLEPVVHWSDTHDRIWLAGNCWANPMEDWMIRDGAAECLTTGGDRNIHLITHQKLRWIRRY